MKNWFFLFVLLGMCSCKNDSQKVETSEKQEISNPQTEMDLLYLVGQDYLIDDQHSYIGFKIKYFGFSPVRGRFDSFDGTVFYDPKHILNTNMTVFIQANSINTGNERRDNDLITGDGWFDENHYPNITFESTKTEVNADGSLQVIGNFSMNGITRALQLDSTSSKAAAYLKLLDR